MVVWEINDTINDSQRFFSQRTLLLNTQAVVSIPLRQLKPQAWKACVRYILRRNSIMDMLFFMLVQTDGRIKFYNCPRCFISYAMLLFKGMLLHDHKRLSERRQNLFSNPRTIGFLLAGSHFKYVRTPQLS